MRCDEIRLPFRIFYLFNIVCLRYDFIYMKKKRPYGKWTMD